MDGIEGQETFKSVMNKTEQFMEKVEEIRENVMNESNGLFILELLQRRRNVRKRLNLIKNIIDRSPVSELQSELENVNKEIDSYN